MTSHLHDQRGWTLIELLIASTLMIVVLLATLTTLDGFRSNTARATQTNDAQDRLRTAFDRVVRQLRNLANPTNGTVQTISYADPYQIVFQTTDPNKQWVMYCLDGSGNLWYEASSGGSSATPPGGSGSEPCPTPASGSYTGWILRTIVADHVTNGSSRPLFAYEGNNGSIPASSGVASSALNSIQRVTMDGFLNLTSDSRREIELTSGVDLRNQFAPPTAQFTPSFSNAGETWIFDASPSQNPQANTAAPYLLYSWYIETGAPAATDILGPNTSPSISTAPDCSDLTSTFTIGATTWRCLGTGIRVTHDFTGDPNPSENIWLRTTNSGKLSTFSSLPATGDCLDSATRTDTNQCVKIQGPF